MKAWDIFKQTIIFVWMRLGVNLLISVGVILWTVIWILIAGAVDNGIMYLLALIAVCVSIKIVGLVQQYIDYMVKSAQIAVVAEMFQTGNVPKDMVQFGKEQVKKKFATANVYIVLDKLVSGSVRQINKVVNSGVGWIEKLIPQAAFLSTLIQKFTTLTLTYVDECCLCYTFMKSDQSAFQSAADGVVIYFQNWKGLLKSSAKGTGIAFAVELILGIIVFLLTMLVVSLFDAAMGWLLALVVAITLIYSLRDAFLGSYMMIYTMENFNREVQTGTIAVDLYGKLCGMSKKFKELWEKGRSEALSEPQKHPIFVAGGTDTKDASLETEPTWTCSKCGAQQNITALYCASCGTHR